MIRLLLILITAQLIAALLIVGRPSRGEAPGLPTQTWRPVTGTSAVAGRGPIPPAPRHTPQASRHRQHVATLRWHALALCESSGNPHAVSPSGKYRGAFQMDADFWRTYGGLEYAPRPDLASYEQQRAVAQRGYDARGRQPWPVCGRRL